MNRTRWLPALLIAKLGLLGVFVWIQVDVSRQRRDNLKHMMQILAQLDDIDRQVKEVEMFRKGLRAAGEICVSYDRSTGKISHHWKPTIEHFHYDGKDHPVTYCPDKAAPAAARNEGKGML